MPPPSSAAPKLPVTAASPMVMDHVDAAVALPADGLDSSPPLEANSSNPPQESAGAAGRQTVTKPTNSSAASKKRKGKRTNAAAEPATTSKKTKTGKADSDEKSKCSNACYHLLLLNPVLCRIYPRVAIVSMQLMSEEGYIKNENCHL
jgi:hypothetical protein